MFEYAAFNPFNASAEGLAAELTRKSAEGWEVVSITTTHDGRFCAFLRRPARTTAPASAISSTVVSAATAVTNDLGATTSANAAATPAVPAAWYKDPSGRYELRYWNGTAWTEHVARAGQQFTDPPVA